MAKFPSSLVGTTLNYTLPPHGRAMQEPANKVLMLQKDDSVLTFSTPEKLTLRRATNAVGKSTSDQSIEARFFEYVSGYVTICKGGMGGFLSGPFSGCWFMRFFMAGAYHAAHIGTEGSNENTSALVKRAFLEYSESMKKEMHQFSCFNPNSVWPDADKRELVGHTPGPNDFYNLAYIDPSGKCYSFFLIKKGAGRKTLTTKSTSRLPKRMDPVEKPGWTLLPSKTPFVSHSWEVAGAREVTSRDWNDLKAKEFGK